MGHEIEQFGVTQKNPSKLTHNFLKKENKYVDVEEAERSPKTLKMTKSKNLHVKIAW